MCGPRCWGEVFFGRGSSSGPHKWTGPRRSLQGPTGNFVSTRLATGAQVKQFLGVCEGVLVSSAVERVVSVTQVHPQCRRASPGWVGLQPPRVGGLPHGRCLPRADGAHPSAEGLDRTEGGGRWDLPFCTCLGIKLVSSHLLSPGPQASGLGVTHTTCFLGPQSATAARWTSQPPSSQEPSPHRKPPWGRTCPLPVSLESPHHQHIETCVMYVM